MRVINYNSIDSLESSGWASSAGLSEMLSANVMIRIFIARTPCFQRKAFWVLIGLKYIRRNKRRIELFWEMG
jgi:hypothetical protein